MRLKSYDSKRIPLRLHAHDSSNQDEEVYEEDAEDWIERGIVTIDLTLNYTDNIVTFDLD